MQIYELKADPEEEAIRRLLKNDFNRSNFKVNPFLKTRILARVREDRILRKLSFWRRMAAACLTVIALFVFVVIFAQHSNPVQTQKHPDIKLQKRTPK